MELEFLAANQLEMGLGERKKEKTASLSLLGRFCSRCKGRNGKDL